MYRINWFCLVISLILITMMCSCQKVNIMDYTPNTGTFCASDTDKALTDKPIISVNGKDYRTNEISEEIQNTFNSVLYYHGTIGDFITDTNAVLNKEIRYELYFKPNYSEESSSIMSPQVFGIIVNMEHPSSTENCFVRYAFGIDLTEYGLKTDFSYLGQMSPNDYSALVDASVYLGSHSVNIEEIKRPTYEEKTKEWKDCVESAVRLYMDENDFYAEEGKNLKPGNYRIYIQNFSEGDQVSTIIFEHDNGDIYSGVYYFVQEATKDMRADLNKVALIKGDELPTFKEYFDKVKLNPAVSFEYTVKIKLAKPEDDSLSSVETTE